MELNLSRFKIAPITKERALLDEIYNFYGKKKGICGQLYKWFKEKGFNFVQETFRQVSKVNHSWEYFAAVVSRAEIKWK